MTSLVHELGKYKVSLAGNTESRLTGCDVRRVEDAVVMHSGSTQQINGVALVLKKGSFQEISGIGRPAVSDHILQARIAHRHGHHYSSRCICSDGDD